jgi:hypothetical protein
VPRPSDSAAAGTPACRVRVSPPREIASGRLCTVPRKAAAPPPPPQEQLPCGRALCQGIPSEVAHMPRPPGVRRMITAARSKGPPAASSSPSSAGFRRLIAVLDGARIKVIRQPRLILLIR